MVPTPPEKNVDRTADLYALDVLENARLLADLALSGHRDAEETVNWIYGMALNARIAFCCARGDL